jgi:hypothetical protein
MSLFPTSSNHEVDDFIVELQSEINSENQIKMQRFDFRRSGSESEYSPSGSISDDSEKSAVILISHSEIKETRRRINFDFDMIPTLGCSFNSKANLFDDLMSS